MKKLPNTTGSWRNFYRISTAPVQSLIFSKALEWKVFDHLNVPVPAGNVAEKMGFDPRNIELFLNVLAGMGILIKKERHFVNGPEAAEFLDSRRKTYMGTFLQHVSGWHNSIEADLDQLVKNGAPKEKFNFADQRMWAESAKKSAPYQYTGAATEAAAIISKLPEFPKMKKMLDLGGGAGFYTIGIVGSHPEMEGVIFDQPAVAEVAQGFVNEYEAADRIKVMKGNYMEDDIGSGYDLIFASATLNFVKDRLDHIIKKIYEALAPGGIFVSHADGLYEERTQPVNYVAEFLTSELMGNDFGFPKGMIADSMKRAGFINIESTFTDTSSGIMDIDIGRKVK